MARKHSKDREGQGARLAASSLIFSTTFHKDVSMPSLFSPVKLIGISGGCKGHATRMRPELDVVTHICKHSTQQAEARGWEIQGHSGQHNQMNELELNNKTLLQPLSPNNIPNPKGLGKGESGERSRVGRRKERMCLLWVRVETKP